MSEEPNVRDDRLDELVRNLSQRMNQSRWRARIFLFLVVVLLGLSTVAFVLAGDLPITERKTPAPYRQLVGVDLNDVVSCRERVVVVGDSGTIGLSTDGGEHWRTVQSQTSKHLWHAAFSKNCIRIVVIGDDGTAVYSSDGGQSWRRGSDTGADYTNSLAFSADGTTAVVVGDDGLFMASYDGGALWERHLGLGSGTARDIALTNNGRKAVIAGDEGMALVLSRTESGIFTVPSHYTPIEVDGRHPDLDVALIVDDQSGSRPFVFGRGTFEYVGEWQQRTENRSVRDATYGGGCFVSVGRAGQVWISSNGHMWDSVGSGQGEHIDEIVLSDDGTGAVARIGVRALLIGKRAREASCEFTWKHQNARTDHSRIAHVGGSRFLVVGRSLDDVDGGDSVILSVDADYEGSPVNVGVKVGHFVEVEADDGDENDARKDLIEMGVPARELFWGELLMRGFLRVGVTAVFLFLTAHLFGLARYEFRLATYYAARKDVLTLADGGIFSNPASIDELDQLMRAMSPEHIEERASSSNMAFDHALQILRGRTTAPSGSTSTRS